MADRPLANLFDRFDVARLPAILRAGDDGGARGHRLVMRFQADPVPGRIDTGRLLREDVFAGRDRLADIGGAEAGRCGQQHDIDVRIVEHPLVAVQAAMHVGVGERHLVFVGCRQGLAERGTLRHVEIGGRHELHSRVDRQRVIDRAGTTAATAHDPQPQLSRFFRGSHR